MQNWTKFSNGRRPFRLNALAGAVALVCCVSGETQAAPLDPLGVPVKLNGSPPELILSLDVDMNNRGDGVALWQRHNEDGRYATYFRRFDRFGTVSSLQTHELATFHNPARLLKVFDNGEFAIENRQGNVVKITIRNKTGGFARVLEDIYCYSGYYSSYNCSVAMDDEGDIVMVDHTSSDVPHVMAQLLDRTGTVVKPWFIVDQPVAGGEAVGYGGVDVAMDADGDFVVAWNMPPDSYDRVEFSLIRLFRKDGMPKGDQFTDRAIVNFDGPGALAMDADGDFIVSGGGIGSYGSWWNDGVTVYRKDGTRVQQSNDGGYYSRMENGQLRVAMDDNGNYIRHQYINYTDFGHPYAAKADFSLYRSFTLTRLGSRTLADMGDTVNPTYVDYEYPLMSDVAMDGKGNVAALWVQSRGDAGDPLGLFLQRFTGPLGEGCGGAGATIVGNDAANTINGTAGDDVIHGKGGNDVIHGYGGNDTICGGAGLDRLYGDAGNDRVFGESGADQLFGGSGNDNLDGGLDVDFIDGGLGTDRCLGESVKNCP
ncbi:MAG: hemolysin-type calcium-binding repeat family protein [Proteobacteria bacterium]|nr:hemolysin-type calcium-binding repeat family protein [Pseudomonadota bacterium]